MDLITLIIGAAGGFVGGVIASSVFGLTWTKLLSFFKAKVTAVEVAIKPTVHPGPFPAPFPPAEHPNVVTEIVPAPLVPRPNP